ncbi:MAG: hypothetical protein ABJA32_07665, partial [Ginsengibacter sp.]
MDENNVPKILQHKDYFDGASEPFKDMRQAYAPLIWQCRYGGIEVPEKLWRYADSGIGKKYSENQSEDVMNDKNYMEAFFSWITEFEQFVNQKGKIQHGSYRAYGYRPPIALGGKIRSGLRAFKLRFGKAPGNSSPYKQQELGLNRNTTIHPKKTEGEKIRQGK